MNTIFPTMDDLRTDESRLSVPAAAASLPRPGKRAESAASTSNGAPVYFADTSRRPISRCDCTRGSRLRFDVIYGTVQRSDNGRGGSQRHPAEIWLCSPQFSLRWLVLQQLCARTNTFNLPDSDANANSDSYCYANGNSDSDPDGNPPTPTPTPTATPTATPSVTPFPRPTPGPSGTPRGTPPPRP